MFISNCFDLNSLPSFPEDTTEAIQGCCALLSYLLGYKISGHEGFSFFSLSLVLVLSLFLPDTHLHSTQPVQTHMYKQRKTKSTSHTSLHIRVSV